MFSGKFEKRALMKKTFMFIIFIFIIFYLFAQEWSEPINISNIPGSDYLPDIVIDNNGVLHCVWSHIIETWYRIVYYSKSEDCGETWSEPQIISQNIEHACFYPKIASDSQNNLYLIYDLNTGNWTETSVQFQMFDGVSWSDPISLTEGYPGANAPQKVVIDSEDRVYAFFYWFSFRYRYLENGEWSEVLYPYPNPPDADIGFVDIVADINNNLHLTGKYIDYGGPNQTIYANYDKNDDEWSELVFIPNEYVSGGEGIALDNEENPHIITRCSVEPYPYNIDGTQYTYFNGENWSDPILIVEDPQYQVIQVINNDVYLIDREKNDDVYNAVLYIQSNNFEGEIIYTSEFICDFSLQYSSLSGMLNFLFSEYDYQSENADVFLMKKELSNNNISENLIQKLSLIHLKQSYPNPFNPAAVGRSPITKIDFSLNKSGNTTLKVFNVRGQLVKLLVNEHKQKGDYSVIWDGTDMQNRQVSSGVYYYRLQIGNRVKTKSLILVK